jgi:hypothetical protein
MATAAEKPKISSQMKFEYRRLEQLLKVRAAFKTGKEKYSFCVNPRSTSSHWNFENLKVQIGVKGMELALLFKLGYLLMMHEIGHVLYWSRKIDYKKLGYPFSLLNILEDARIEHERADFEPLHRHGYESHYLAPPEEGEEVTEDYDKFADPVNIGILLRWRRWRVETETHRPDKLTEDEYQEFLSDWEQAITDSIAAKSTEGVSEIARALYLKWKELFDESGSGGDGLPGLGGIEGDAEGMSGAGVIEEDDDEDGDAKGKDGKSPKDGKGKPLLEPASSDGSATDCHDSDCFREPWFEWDMPYIKKQVEIIRRLIELKDESEDVYALTGRRFSIPRIENPPMMPFKRKMLSVGKTSFKKMLGVLDGSGSMKGFPFKSGAHLFYILSMIYQMDLRVVTTSSVKPIRISDIDMLRRFRGWGGGENYRSIGENVPGYSFTLFMTDANVCAQDVDYIKNVLSKRTRLGAGYVGYMGHNLDDVFPRNFHADDLNQNIAKMVAMFIKRNFTTISTSAV